jgi:glycosyltransferase involved in cell wall biosynthesis
MRAFTLHDRIVARRLATLNGQIDVVHTWPLGALETLRMARRLGIPTVLERPNANTRFAYEVVRRESERIGVPLPPNHEHAYNETILEKEEMEYELADYLLCPSEFTAKTFRDAGFGSEKLVRHWYGYDEDRFFAGAERPLDRPFTLIFVGVAAVRKGLHFALEAWLSSPASETGTFLVVGEMLPAYEEKLAPMLAHPSVRVLGHRDDVPDLMRTSDAFVLPTIEEGFGLVCTEALACGAVPLVSEACTELCVHGANALVHAIGDVSALTGHITQLYADRALLSRLREAGLRTSPTITWARAGDRLAEIYLQAARREPQRLSA